MASLPAAVRENPLAVALTVAAAAVGTVAVGLALTDSRLRLVIRLAALTVVLAAFAGWFWLEAVGERLG